MLKSILSDAMNGHAISTLLRPARITDAEDLLRNCWPDRLLEHVITLLERAESLHADGRGLGAIAALDDVPCGFGMLTLWPSAAEISDLVVSSSVRGWGIGSQVIEYLTDAARDLDVERLEIGVALNNPRARALYQRLGFRDDRVIELDLGTGPQPVLYLSKRLRVPAHRSSTSTSPL